MRRRFRRAATQTRKLNSLLLRLLSYRISHFEYISPPPRGGWRGHRTIGRNSSRLPFPLYADRFGGDIDFCALLPPLSVSGQKPPPRFPPFRSPFVSSRRTSKRKKQHKEKKKMEIDARMDILCWVYFHLGLRLCVASHFTSRSPPFCCSTSPESSSERVFLAISQSTPGQGRMEKKGKKFSRTWDATWCSFSRFFASAVDVYSESTARIVQKEEWFQDVDTSRELRRKNRWRSKKKNNSQPVDWNFFFRDIISERTRISRIHFALVFCLLLSPPVLHFNELNWNQIRKETTRRSVNCQVVLLKVSRTSSFSSVSPNQKTLGKS